MSSAAIDAELLTEIITERMRGPFGWRTTEGVVVRISAEGAARQIAKLYAERKAKAKPS